MSEPTVGHTAASEAAAQPATFDAAVDAACARIAPAWPLDRLIAVNPYWGFVSQPIEDAAAHLTALSGTRMVMPRAWYRARYQEQTLTERHIQLAIEQSGSALDATKVLACLEAPEPAESRYPTVVDVIDASRDLSHAVSYDELVTRQLSQACAAYVDRAQASWPLSREGGFYAGFRRLLAEDASPRLLVGRAGLAAASRALPTEPRALLRHALEVLGVTPSEREDYLTALLLSILGWASAFAFTRWEARLTGGDDEDIVHLLAARLTWELLLYQEVASADVRQTVRRARASFRSRPLAARTAGEAEWVLQRAVEVAYQQRLVPDVEAETASAPDEAPRAQLVFCIDVRSEVMRRSVEAEGQDLHTLGFAGFFGLTAVYQPLRGPARAQLPGLLAPSLQIADRGPRQSQAGAAVARSAEGLGLVKELSRNPVATFSWVEALGLGALGALVRDTFALGDGGADPLRTHAHAHSLVPTLVGPDGEELPLARRVTLAGNVLRGMSLTARFGRLVVLFGHAATSDNNPQAAGLQCGACGGQSGEVNARALAGLLNDRAVRAGLVNEGIAIPETTRFVGGVHDTTTDDLRLYDLDGLAETHADDVARLRRDLLGASERARRARAASMGLDGLGDQALQATLRRRSRDWSEVRPEWALARNAAFIAAPRERTRGLDLDGRVFLHEYRPAEDEGFRVLEQIMCAPMVVAHMIGMQYYASTVDNPRYGSGNKVLHNVVGGTVGVFEGAGGDLRIGLALQSLHDGSDWVHTPQRLSVLLEAPRDAIDAVVTKHALVRDLVENEWLFLFSIEPGGGAVYRRTASGWRGGEYA